jgi:DNA-binding response OmpR family regulator
MQPCGVLVVDDDTPLREALRFLFEDTGYAVDEAPDGVVALDALRRAERPLVVLLNVMLLRMSGVDLLSAVTEEAQLLHAPVHPDDREHHAAPTAPE